MKQVIFQIILLLLANFSYSQNPNPVLKFDCKALVIENLSTKSKENLEGYHLLVMDWQKGKVDIYPDSLIMNVVSTVSKHVVDERLIFEFKCIDSRNNVWLSQFSYLKGLPEIIKFTGESTAFYYFIEKQIQ